jgi:hypothetical protein
MRQPSGELVTIPPRRIVGGEVVLGLPPAWEGGLLPAVGTYASSMAPARSDGKLYVAGMSCTVSCFFLAFR